MKIRVMRFGESIPLTYIDVADIVYEKWGERPLDHNIIIKDGVVWVFVGKEPEDWIARERGKEIE